MDYEKEYNAALERASIIYTGKYKPEIAAFCKQTLEAVFPELEDYLDMRIIKEITFFLKVKGGYNKDWIAWLEKLLPVDAKVIAKEVKQGIALSPSIWYDVSLIPQEQQELLVEWDSEDATWHDVAFYHAYSKTFWNCEKQIEGVTRWCYIKDLLGKQDEKESVNEVKDYNSIDPHFSKPQGKSALEAINEEKVDNANKVETMF